MNNYQVFLNVEGFKVIHIKSETFKIQDGWLMFITKEKVVAIFVMSQILGFSNSDGVGK